MSNIPSKLSKLFSCGERLNASDLNSIVGAYNAIINYLNDQGSSPGTVNTLNWPLDSINSAGLSDNGGTRDIGANMVIASTEEKGKWQWLQINNNTGLLWDDLNGGKGNDNTIIDPTHIPLATNNTVGGIKIGYPVNHQDKKYPVELDSDTKGAYVHVPWTGGDGNVTSINEIPIQNGTPKEGLILKYRIENGQGKWKFEADLQGNGDSGDNPGSGTTLLDVWKSLTKNNGLSNLNNPSLLKISNDYLDLSFFNSAGNESSNPLKNYTWWGRSLEKVGDSLTVSGNLEGNILYIKFGSGNDALILGLDNGKLKLYKANGDPATFYATGGVSALGIGTSEGGESTGVILGDFLASLNGFSTPLREGYLYYNGQNVEWTESGPGNNGINITGDLPEQRGAGSYVLLYNIVSDGNDGTQTSYTVSSTKYEPLLNSVLKQINVSSVGTKSNSKENLGKHSLYYEVTSKTTTNNNGEEVTTYSGQWMWNKVGNNSELNKILTGINNDQTLNSFIDSTHNEASNKILYYKIVKEKEAVTDPNDETVIISPAEYSGTWQWGDFKEAVGLGNILSSIDGLDGLNLPPNNLESDKILHYVVTKNIVDDPENPGSTTTTYDFGWQFMDLSSINSLKNEILIDLNENSIKFPTISDSNLRELNSSERITYAKDYGFPGATHVSNKFYFPVYSIVKKQTLLDNGEIRYDLLGYRWENRPFKVLQGIENTPESRKIDEDTTQYFEGYLHRYINNYGNYTYEWVDDIEGITYNEGNGILILDPDGDGKYSISLKLRDKGLLLDSKGLGVRLVSSDDNSDVSGLQIVDKSPFYGLKIKLSSDDNGLELSNSGLKIKLATDSSNNTNNSGLIFDDNNGGLKINLATDSGLEFYNGALRLSNTSLSGELNLNNWAAFFNGKPKSDSSTSGYLYVNDDTSVTLVEGTGISAVQVNGITFVSAGKVLNLEGSDSVTLSTSTNNNVKTITFTSSGGNGEGTSSVTINTSSTGNYWAPTSAGTSGYILTSGGSGTAPSWTDPSTITVGAAAQASKLSKTRTLWGNQDTNGIANIGVDGSNKSLNYVDSITMYGNLNMLNNSDDSEGAEILMGGKKLDIHLDNYCQDVDGLYSRDNLCFRIFGSYVENSQEIPFGHNLEYYIGRGGLHIGSGYTGSYLQIGNVKIIAESDNTLKIQKSDGTAGNLYATGGISALGLSSGSNPSIDNLTVNNVLTVNSASSGNNNGIVFTGNTLNRLYCEDGNIKSTGPFVFNSDTAQGNIYVDGFGFHVNNGEGFHFGDYKLYMLDNTLKLTNGTNIYTISMTQED